MQNHKHTGANQHTNKLWVSEEIKEEIKKNTWRQLKMNTLIQILWIITKAVLRGTFSYIRLLWETRTISDKHLTTPK